MIRVFVRRYHPDSPAPSSTERRPERCSKSSCGSLAGKDHAIAEATGAADGARRVNLSFRCVLDTVVADGKMVVIPWLRDAFGILPIIGWHLSGTAFVQIPTQLYGCGSVCVLSISR
jgi:hypothetical protein